MATGEPIRILLIDDHALVRTGLRLLIEQQPHLWVVGEAVGRAEALALAAAQQPAIILLDLDLGDERGVDLLPDLLAAARQARVIVVTGVRSAGHDEQQAVRLGALGVVRKEQAATVLVQAIEHVYAGRAWLDPALMAQLITSLAREHDALLPPAGATAAAGPARLTRREREVMQLVIAGLHNRQIAERLSISQSTVSHHLTAIFNKLGLATRFDLVVYAHRHGLGQTE